jgi:thiol-disulfide isomerase/thioredoxin
MMTLRSLAARRILALSCAAALLGPALYGLDRRQPAPKFTAKTLDGERITNDTIKGNILLIQFWATWCGYCRRDQPVVEKLTEEYADKGLVVVAVNVGESRKKVRAFLEASPRKAKIVLMEDTNLAAVFRARGLPYYVALDAEGNVAAIQSGAGGIEPLKELLSRAGLQVE